MSVHPPFCNVFDGAASPEQLSQMFNRHRDTPDIDARSGEPYTDEWFEITASGYRFMLDLLPPLFQRTDMFGFSEFRAGYITSVFFAIRIRARGRRLPGFCDLSDKRSPDAMRIAIVAHEAVAIDSMTREETLEAVWTATRADSKHGRGDVTPDAWAPEHRGKRTILVNAGALGTILKQLEDLSDEEITGILRRRSRHVSRRRGCNADHP